MLTNVYFDVISQDFLLCCIRVCMFMPSGCLITLSHFVCTTCNIRIIGCLKFWSWKYGSLWIITSGVWLQLWTCFVFWKFKFALMHMIGFPQFVSKHKIEDGLCSLYYLQQSVVFPLELWCRYKIWSIKQTDSSRVTNLDACIDTLACNCLSLTA